MNGAPSSKLHCPNRLCQKPLLTQVAMAEGTRFVMRCPWCQTLVRIIATFTTVHKRILTDARDSRILGTSEAELHTTDG